VSVHLTRRDQAAIVTLDRPEQLNALSFSILGRLGEIFDEVATSDARPPRMVGEARALEMIMTGRTVRAEEALAAFQEKREPSWKDE
jgi:enoyl-CoA hydratase/carnithine racemase